MKISNILILLAMLFAVACNTKNAKNDHGHEHGTEEHGHAHDEGMEDHAHEHDAAHQQEEFIIQGDSTQAQTDTTQHRHEDGSTHHEH